MVLSDIYTYGPCGALSTCHLTYSPQWCPGFNFCFTHDTSHYDVCLPGFLCIPSSPPLYCCVLQYRFWVLQMLLAKFTRNQVLWVIFGSWFCWICNLCFLNLFVWFSLLLKKITQSNKMESFRTKLLLCSEEIQKSLNFNFLNMLKFKMAK